MKRPGAIMKKSARAMTKKPEGALKKKALNPDTFHPEARRRQMKPKSAHAAVAARALWDQSSTNSIFEATTTSRDVHDVDADAAISAPAWLQQKQDSKFLAFVSALVAESDFGFSNWASLKTDPWKFRQKHRRSEIPFSAMPKIQSPSRFQDGPDASIDQSWI